MKYIILFFLALLVSVYFCAGFLYDPKYVLYIKPIFVPLFLSYDFFSNKEKLPLKYYFFVALFYLGETVLLISDVIEIYLALGLFFYFLSYLALSNLVYNPTRAYNFKNSFKGYTLFVIILNCFFLGIILYLIFEQEKNYLLIFIISLNAISAILLTVNVVYYLAKNYNSNSFFYFVGCFCILISDIFAALVKYYINDFILNFIDRFLHLLGFVMIYFFVTKKSLNDKVSDSKINL